MEINGTDLTPTASATTDSPLAVHVVLSIMVTALLIPTTIHIRKDFLAFVALGPGGTPPTWIGYLRVKFLGLFALSDPYQPLDVPAELLDKGFLHDLPKRQHPRPVTAGIAPHRQLTQRSEPRFFRMVVETAERMAASNEHMALGTSCFEKHGTGLFTTLPIRRTCRGEIFHCHPSDGSIHLTLHAVDANIVLKAGWGERHPIARGGWLKRFVPKGFTMIYAPQTESEVATVFEIVQAAAWFVNGGSARPDHRKDDEVRRDSGCSY